MLALATMVVAGPVAPVQLSYATSDSMAPAITEGDLYVVFKGSSDIAHGDIITFYSTSRSEYVTHRVVERTDRGFITQGDANPSTDQAAGHRPVKEPSIVGRVFTLGGAPVTIPFIGPAIIAIQSNRYLLMAIVGALLLGDLLRDRWLKSIPRHDVVRIGEVIRPLLIMAIVVCFVLILLGASSHSVVYVATGQDNTAPNTVETGEPAERSLQVDIWKLPITTTVVDVDGLTVLDRQRRGSTVDLRVRVPPQEEIGPYRAVVTVRPYPATLPYGVLKALTKVHWFAAVIGSMLPIFGPVAASYLLMIDGRTPIRTNGSRLLRRLGGSRP